MRNIRIPQVFTLIRSVVQVYIHKMVPINIILIQNYKIQFIFVEYVIAM